MSAGLKEDGVCIQHHKRPENKQKKIFCSFILL